MTPLTTSVTMWRTMVDVELVVEVVDVDSDSAEQINRVHGDLGAFSIIGHKIGASGVAQLSILYNGQLRLVE